MLGSSINISWPPSCKMVDAHKVRNIHLTLHYDLGYDFAGYREMYRLSRSSMEKNLKSVNEFVTIENNGRVPKNKNKPHVKCTSEMFKDCFEQTRDLWFQGDCNIFFTDIDTLCLRPLDIFGRFDKMRLFALAGDPNRPSKYDTPWSNLPVELYFNSGVRYFPSTMNPDLWNIGTNAIDYGAWDDTRWDYEQAVYNMMYYTQFGAFPPNARPEPLLDDHHYMCGDNNDTPQPNVRTQDVKIKHYSGQWGSTNCLRRMRQDLEEVST